MPLLEITLLLRNSVTFAVFVFLYCMRNSVTFAVFVFLYCMAALLLYVGYTNLYRESRKLPMVDFIVTLIATFLWLVSTSAWAKALTDIKAATGYSIVQELEPFFFLKKAQCALEWNVTMLIYSSPSVLWFGPSALQVSILHL
ncbi:Synaptophysin-like protein 1 [Manis javanica]|nr:Synaptophysin-like protein 1 [Manis javanica]